MNDLKNEMKDQREAIETKIKNLTDQNMSHFEEINALKVKNSEMNEKINSLTLENEELRRLVATYQNETATKAKAIYFHVGLSSTISSSANERVKFDIIREESDDKPYDTQNGRIIN